MSITNFLGATALVASLAAPAVAQYQPYPAPQPYPQSYPQQGYGYQQQGYAQNPVQSIIDQLLGNRYATNDRTAVAQCAAAAQNQAAAQYRPNAYGQQPYGNAYGYNQGYNGARVTGITNVERRSNGLRVSGTMSSGMQRGYANQGYNNRGYNQGYAAAANDLTFRCNVDYRGAVTNVRVRPATAWRR